MTPPVFVRPGPTSDVLRVVCEVCCKEAWLHLPMRPQAMAAALTGALREHAECAEDRTP